MNRIVLSKNTSLIFVILSCLFSVQAQNKFLNLTNFKITTNSQETSIPERKLKRIANGVIISYQFEYMGLRSTVNQKPDYELSFAGFHPTMGHGLPAIPGRVDIFYIPVGYDVTLDISEANYQELHASISSSTPYLPDSEPRTLEREQIKKYTDLYPESPVSIQSERQMGDWNLVYVNVSPVQYNNEDKIIRVYSKLEYRLKYNKNSENSSNLRNNQNFQKDMNSCENIFRVSGIIPLIENESKIKNVNTIAKQLASGLQRQTPIYIIVTPRSLSSAANKLADWKRCQGFNVIVLSSRIWNTSTIQTQIKNTYNHYLGKFYCLLLGDIDKIPAFEKEYTNDYDGKTYPYKTDLPYFCISGNDHIPEISYGRLPASNLDEATIMINKIINYELNPPRNASFYNTATAISVYHDEEDQTLYFNPWEDGRETIPSKDLFVQGSGKIFTDGFEDRRYCQTTQEIYEYLSNNYNKTIDRIYFFSGGSYAPGPNPSNWSMLFDFGGKTPADFINNNINWDQGSDEFINSINSGSSFVYYIGHGEEDEWAFINIDKYAFKELSNSDKLPVIIAVACDTGANGGQLIPNILLSNNNGGCIAYVGATGVSFTGPNTPFAHGLINAFWPNPGLATFMKYTPNTPDESDDCIPYYPSYSTPIYELFDALQAGFLRSEQVFISSEEINNQQREKYEIFGDPSIMPYTENPYSSKNGIIQATVTRVGNSVSVHSDNNNGVISFYDSASKKVQSHIGSSTATFSTDSPESVVVTIRNPNRPLFINKGKNVKVSFEQ